MMQNVNIRGREVKGIQELSVLLMQLLVSAKLC